MARTRAPKRRGPRACAATEWYYGSRYEDVAIDVARFAGQEVALSIGDPEPMQPKFPSGPIGGATLAIDDIRVLTD